MENSLLCSRIPEKQVSYFISLHKFIKMAYSYVNLGLCNFMIALATNIQ